MAVYLEAHTPSRQQFYTTRNKPVTCIVVHTPETKLDLILPDASAESVAAFIAARPDAGSYHSIVDADSIVRVCKYEWTAFHCVGANSWSLGLSVCAKADQWPTLPDWYRDAVIANAAREAANMARWINGTQGILIEARLLSAAEAKAGHYGFTSHAAMDPTRRSDPGAGFPWDEFLTLFTKEMTLPASPAPEIKKEEPMMLYHQAMAEVDELYEVYRPTGITAAERKAWGKDLAERMFVKGEDPHPALQYIQSELAKER